MKFVVVFAVIISIVAAHSWTACTDYRILNAAQDAAFYNDTLCLGYPRKYKDSVVDPNTFGLDRGFNFQPAGGPTCRDQISGALTSAYDTRYPLAKYAPGQTVCLAWPSKNHVSATCNNPNIPDNGMKVLMNPTANPTADAAIGTLTVVKDFGSNTVPDGHVGYQNCPQFCSNADKSLCTGCFTVPNNLVPGNIHTFVWTWAFNAPTDLYTTCWEAQIVGTAIGIGATPIDNAPAQTLIPCTQNSECPSGVCKIDGFCLVKSGLDAGGGAAIAFSILFLVAVVVGILLVFFRNKLPSKIPAAA